MPDTVGTQKQQAGEGTAEARGILETFGPALILTVLSGELR